MSEKDEKGVSKISALQAAAKNLVSEIMTDESGTVRIALVP
jgi:hypothetical protein